MIDESMLKSLSTDDKESFKKGLEDLINQTYVIENEYKSLNESYNSLQSFISSIVETMPNALWVLESDGNIFLQNSEAIGLKELLPKINLDTPNKEMDFNEHSYLIKIIKKDEKTIIQATDITGEKRKERLASMGQVAAHLSHEIRNPIGSVSLLASTLFNKVDVTCKPIVLEMKRSIWRVERIIKATLLFTKGIQVNFTNFYIDDLNNECNQAISYYTYTKDIDFDINLPHIKISGDKDLLSLVLQNLLFNAIDAIEESENETLHVVKLSYGKEDDFHIICVEDSGVEIKDDNILLEPFKTTKTKGNGLGLTLSTQIANAHNGNIFIQKNPKRFCLKIKNG